MKKISIAIDGPAAAGKSTIAKMVAKKLNYTYIDTGAMYRCVAYATLKQGLAFEDEKAVSDLLKNMQIEMKPEGTIYLNGEDVTSSIRQNEVSMGASIVSKYQAVREFLVEKQREMAQGGGVILDGRDIGTVVLPDAELKIFMIASVDERAERRYKENIEKGIPADLETLKKEIAERDYKDSHREVSPLRPAEDAITFDTTGVSIDGVVEFIQEKAKKIIDKG